MCLARGLWRNKAEEIFKVGIIMKQCVFGGGIQGLVGQSPDGSLGIKEGHLFLDKISGFVETGAGSHQRPDGQL